mmetsp:Transcript_18264/g.28080  ORF Transcript_18264/g.28080 Transcript_18264/m.28080 type:complete len:112 (+) Transcript_18264:886-1221(+)|eukprot:CAMPEP_0170502592 /NCGR_PEP_ID=MMETSP0208-20121228/41970_1 /TAXON_ID=197538 /ORGANISM="Strombidium inclinatum, Strain S3" /LENGTH=111 /DNA_ID=CAMNT_0010781747 /DNA_START=357 /DNA_END=692 /DNA_ORIENTATION=+
MIKERKLERDRRANNYRLDKMYALHRKLEVEELKKAQEKLAEDIALEQERKRAHQLQLYKQIQEAKKGKKKKKVKKAPEPKKEELQPIEEEVPPPSYYIPGITPQAPLKPV